MSLIPGLGRSPGEGNGNPLQYSCLEKSHGRRSLVGYSPWGHKELGHDLVTIQHTHTYICVCIDIGFLQHICHALGKYTNHRRQALHPSDTYTTLSGRKHTREQT